MIHKQIFTTGVRLFGVWEILRLIDYLVQAYDMKAGFYRPSLQTIESTYSHAVIYGVVGLYLLGGAPPVVNFFYPPAKAVDVVAPERAAPDA